MKFFTQWLDAYAKRMEDKVVARVLAKIEADKPEPKPTVTAEQIMKPVMRPFAVNRVPGRKLRADLEWKHSPEYRKQQELIRETRAKQPNGH